MRIYISSSSATSGLAKTLTTVLTDAGHKVSNSSTAKLNNRENTLTRLVSVLKNADVFISVRNDIASTRDKYTLVEQQTIKMLVDTDESKHMILTGMAPYHVPISLKNYPSIEIESVRPNFDELLKTIEMLSTTPPSENGIITRKAQFQNLEQLQNAHLEGKLTLVCGAGISIGAKIPPWSTLLDRLITAMLRKLAPDENKLDAAMSELNDIRDNSSLIAGRYLKNVLQDDFEEEVRKALYQDSKETCDIIDAIVELARPQRGRAHLESIISFNFDDLLEQNFKKSSIVHKPIHSEGSRCGASELPIFHVHGYLPKQGKLDKNSKIVFSEDSYHDQFVDPFSWSNLTQLNKFTQNTCLFVGLSMTDPNLRRLLDVAKRRDGKGDNRHFVVLKRNPNSSRNRMMESLREQDAASLGISILWVEEYDEIPNLIKSIA